MKSLFILSLLLTGIVAYSDTSSRWSLSCEDLAETRPWNLSTIIGKDLLQESASVTFSKQGEVPVSRTGSFFTRLLQSSTREFSIRFAGGEQFVSKIDLSTNTGTGIWSVNATTTQLTCILRDLTPDEKETTAAQEKSTRNLKSSFLAVDVFSSCTVQTQNQIMLYVLNNGSETTKFFGTLPITIYSGPFTKPQVIYTHFDHTLSYNVFTRHYVYNSRLKPWRKDIRRCSVDYEDLMSILQ